MKMKRTAAIIAGAAILAAAAVPAFGALPDSMQHAVLSSLDVICAPSGIMQIADNTLLVTDTYHKVIWKVENGVCTLYSGGDTVKDPYEQPVGGYNDAEHIRSFFRNPWGITPFLNGFAVSDADNRAVRLLRPEKTETVNGYSPVLRMNDLGVVFSYPTGLATDPEGNLYIADTHEGAIRRCTTDGQVDTVIDGLNNPMGLCWFGDALYIAETGSNRILRVSHGKRDYIAGSGTDGFTDGAAAAAAFSSPQELTVGPDGTVYISDTGNGAVRRLRGGTVDTLAKPDPNNPMTYPVSPRGLCVMDGVLYVCDNFSHQVFMIRL